MKKWIGILCAVFCFVSLVGCRVRIDSTPLLSAGEISSVRVFSQPEHYDCFYYGVHAKPIVEYLEGLSLQSDFDENPEEYNGMTIIITLVYEDGRELTVYHSGNMFIRAENGDWFKMEYDQAKRLQEILNEKQP